MWQKLNLDWDHWTLGLLAAFVGGAAGALSAGGAAAMITPEHYNITSLKGVGHLLFLMGLTAFFAGIPTAAAYLKQSPIPAPRGTWTPEQRDFEKAKQALLVADTAKAAEEDKKNG